MIRFYIKDKYNKIVTRKKKAFNKLLNITAYASSVALYGISFCIYFTEIVS